MSTYPAALHPWAWSRRASGCWTVGAAARSRPSATTVADRDRSTAPAPTPSAPPLLRARRRTGAGVPRPSPRPDSDDSGVTAGDPLAATRSTRSQSRRRAARVPARCGDQPATSRAASGSECRVPFGTRTRAEATESRDGLAPRSGSGLRLGPEGRSLCRGCRPVQLCTAGSTAARVATITGTDRGRVLGDPHRWRLPIARARGAER